MNRTALISTPLRSRKSSNYASNEWKINGSIGSVYCTMKFRDVSNFVLLSCQFKLKGITKTKRKNETVGSIISFGRDSYNVITI